MATYNLGLICVVEGFEAIRGVSNVEVKRSLNNYLDTAKVVLPSKAIVKTASGFENSTTNKLFKRGMKITIDAAYNEFWNKEFEGFISRVDNKVPTTIECEGYAFQLRGKYINKVYRKSSLRAVLNDLIEGTDIELSSDIEDMELDKLEYIKFPRIEALSKLGQDLGGVSFWFVGKKLHGGLKYTFFSEANKENKPDVVYKAGHNFERDGSIKERESRDEPGAELVFSDESGKKTKAGAGRRQRLSALLNEQDAQRIAAEVEKRKNFNGVEGSITGLLYPLVNPGDKVQLIDDRFEALNGNYLCEEVTTRISRSGARRSVKLSYKL